MRKIYVLMAVAAIAMVGCKNNGGKKAAAPAEAEEAPVAVSESMNKAIEAIEKLAAAQSEGLVESVAEILEKNPDAVIPFAAVENKPGFNGGDANDFSKWVSENIQYPQDAIDSKIEGRVILQFTVSKEGDVKDVEVLRGVNELLDAEAVRVVSASPKWEAGSQNGVPVAVKYTFPVIFRLN